MIDYTKPPEGENDSDEIRDIFDYYPPSENFKDIYSAYIVSFPYKFLSLDKTVKRIYEKGVPEVSLDINLRHMIIYHRCYLIYREHRKKYKTSLSMEAVFFECKSALNFLSDRNKTNQKILRGMYIVAYNKTYDIKEISGLIAEWFKDFI